MEIDITAIAIGIIGAILGVYFRENFRLAKIQKNTLVKLRAYLEYEHRRFLNSSKDINAIKSFNLPSIDYDSNLNIVDKLIMEVKIKCDYRKKEFAQKEKTKEFSDTLFKFYNQVKNKEGEFAYRSKTDLENNKNDIKTNLVFISDDDASQLNYDLSYLIIHYKGYSLSVLDDLIKIIIYVENNDNLKIEEFGLLVWKFLEDLSCLLNLFDLLLFRTKKISRKNTTVLALKNIFS